MMEEAMDIDYDSNESDEDDEESVIFSGGSFLDTSRSTFYSDDDASTNDESDSRDSFDETDDVHVAVNSTVHNFLHGLIPVSEGRQEEALASNALSQARREVEVPSNGSAAEVAVIRTDGPVVEQTVEIEHDAAENTRGTPEKNKETSIDKTLYSQSPGVEDEGQNCPICFEAWTSSGIHRLASLKCGHLFGLSCIVRWLKGSKAKCPQCNAPAKKSDIRHHYVRCLKALDTSERDQALRDLEKEKELRRRAELDTANMKMRYQMSVQECENLKKELMDHQTLLQNYRNSRKRASSSLDYSAPTTSKSATFALEKSLNISKEGACRVLGISAFFPMLVITQESSNKLFPGYGIKKISTLDMKAAEFVAIHQRPIRDLAFHSYDSLILTAALDKSIKLTNVYSNTIVQTYALPMDAWSCAWNKDDSCCFYAGLKNGRILQFDTRMTNGPVQHLPPTGYSSPVVSLQYVQKKASSQFNMSGPLSLQLSSCCFYEQKVDNGFRIHPLPVEGNFTSLFLEPTTGHALISCRPSVKHPKVTHMLCEMSNVRSPFSPAVDCSVNVIQTLQGGSTQVKLSRSKAFLNPGDECSVLVCAGDDNSTAALIWDVNSGQCVQQLKADSSVLDVCHFRVNHEQFLATLTERTLRVYRWNRN